MKQLAGAVALLFSIGCVPPFEELLPFPCAEDFTCPAGLACVADETMQFVCSAPKLGNLCQPDTDCGRIRDGAVCHVVDATERPWGPGSPGGPIRICAAPPGSPEKIELVRQGFAVHVTWTAPTDAGGLPITGYEVTTIPETLALPLLPAQTTHMFPVQEGKTYEVQVVALNALGKGPPGTASITIHPPSAPGAPRDVVATAGAAEAAVSWKPPLDDGGRTITAYEVTLSPGPTFQVSGSNTSTSAARLRAGTGYTFTVRAINELGKGPATQSNRVVPAAREPTPPQQVEATGGRRRATITWLPPFDDGGSDVIRYDVTVSPGGRTITVPAPAPADAVTEDGPAPVEAVVEGLTPGGSYTFAVTATNSAGQSDPATSPSVPVTPDIPSAPRNVTATAWAASAVVSWEAPEDDGGSPVVLFRVSASSGQSKDVPGKTARFDGLTPGEEISFTVAALNPVGVGAESAPTAPVVPRCRREFVTPPAVVTRTDLRHAVLADMDEDGLMDVVSIHQSLNGAEVRLARPDGTVASAVYLPTNASLAPEHLAVGDLTGDGHLDVVTGTFNGWGFHVFPGNGDGTFQPPVRSVVDGAGGTHRILDFDGDGNADLVAGACRWLGNGDGTLNERSCFGEEWFPNQSAAGDLNGDGLPDLVVARREYDDVQIFLNTGDGQAGAAITVPVGKYPLGVTIADHDGDGRPDVLVANAGREVGQPTIPGTVSFLRNDGSGQFTPMPPLQVWLEPTTLASADVNADGIPDLVVGHAGWDRNVVSVLLGKAGGVFERPVGYLAGDEHRTMQVSDVNSDGFVDVVVGGWRRGTVTWLLNDGTGGFPGVRLFEGGDSISAIVTGDLDADGADDVVTVDGVANVVWVHRRISDTAFASSERATATYPVGAALGDFDGDGKVDVAVASTTGSVAIHLGNGDGTLKTSSTVAAGGAPAGIAAGDLDGDGRADLVVSNAIGRPLLLGGKGDGTFRDPLELPFEKPTQGVALADLDGNGRLDVVLSGDESSTGALLVQREDGTFEVNNGPGSLQVHAFAATDLDDDGYVDVATAEFISWTGSLKARYGTSNGHLGVQDTLYQSTLDNDGTPHRVALASGDFDDDGLKDLFLATSGRKAAYVRADGTRIWSPPKEIPLGIRALQATAGDVDGDGLPEVVYGMEYGIVGIDQAACVP